MTHILLDIFEIACNDIVSVDGWEPHILSSTACNIAEVCKYWRQLALSHSGLWKTLDFSDPVAAGLCLQRSSPATPLHVILANRRGYRGLAGGRRLDNDYSHLLRPHSLWIESIYLHVGDPEEFKGEETQWMIESPPALGVFKELHVVAEQHYDEKYWDYNEEEIQDVLEQYYDPL